MLPWGAAPQVKLRIVAECCHRTPLGTRADPRRDCLCHSFVGNPGTSKITCTKGLRDTQSRSW